MLAGLEIMSNSTLSVILILCYRFRRLWFNLKGLKEYLLINSIVDQKLWHQCCQESNPYSKTKATSWSIKCPPQSDWQGCQCERQLDIVGKIHFLRWLLRISLEISYTSVKQFSSFCLSYFGTTEKNTIKKNTALAVSAITSKETSLVSVANLLGN